MTNAVNIAQGGSNNVTFRNRIINGAMVVNQYSANSVNVTTGNTALVCDRFKITNTTDGTLNVQQSTTAPANFINSTLITATATDGSIGATQYAQIEQRIEGLNVADLGFGTANAKTVTLSFWVNCSVTGIYCVSLANGAGNRSYVTQYSIPVANTWQQVVVTVPGDTTGTWLTTNGKGLVVTFALSVGSTYQQAAGSWGTTSFAIATSSQTNFVGTLNATFYITGVQLEAGSAASPFEYRSYGTELALCQRYYQLGAIFSGSAAYAINTTYYHFGVTLGTAMRVSPSVPTPTNCGTLAVTSGGQDGYRTPLVYPTTAASSSSLYGFTASAEL